MLDLPAGLDHGVGSWQVTRPADLPDDLPVMRAIGVPQIAGYLRGEHSRDDAIMLGQQATRQYAKR